MTTLRRKKISSSAHRIKNTSIECLTLAWRFFSSVHNPVRTGLFDPQLSCVLPEWRCNEEQNKLTQFSSTVPGKLGGGGGGGGL